MDDKNIKSEKMNERVLKIKSWIKQPINAALVSVLILALIIRLYFLFQTQGQTLWWDEAEYMSTAVHWAFDVPYDLNPQRPPLFQLIEAIFLYLGISETIIKLLLVVLPSVFLVYVIYLLGKEIYDERIGLMAAIFATVSWTFVFWSARAQPDFLSMVFQVLAITFMWKYWKIGKYKFVILSGIFSALGLYFKVSGLIVPMIFIVFIAIKDRFSALKDKGYYIYAATFFVSLIPYFIWAYSKFGKVLAFTSGYSDAPTDFSIGWYNIRFYHFLTENILFVLFILGVLIGLRFLLYIDIMLKDKKKILDGDLLGITSLLFISVFYIFYIRNTDDRWVFLWMPFIFFFASSTISFLYEKIKKYNSTFAIFIVFILLASVGYMQLKHASSLIELKEESYSPVKEAALWMKDNSIKEDKIITMSYTQTVYYSMRNVTSYGPYVKNMSMFEDLIKEIKPRYIEISLFESHPSWLIQQGNQGEYSVLALPYTNSTIVSKNGAISSLDIKSEINKSYGTLRYVYPTDRLNGVFVYEVEYK